MDWKGLSSGMVTFWLILVPRIALAQESAASDTASISSLRAQALSALQQGENQTAILAADAMVRQHQDDPRAIRLAADIYLRTGQCDSSVRLFDRYLESHPEQMPGLWQRGIALYFVGDYRRGAKQFEQHRSANPHDVENAAWHFLCVAKSDSIQAARDSLLPAPGDPRIPMKEVHRMLASGDTSAVERRVTGIPEDSDLRADAAFYADFYLGLYADADGQPSKARDFMTRAAEDAPHHYMGDIARVYAKHLAESGK